MDTATVMTLTHQAMKVILYLAAPLLLTTLVVGLVIAVFQAATQINEMTLAFIPKLLAIAVMLALLGPWMLELLVDYIQELFGRIPDLVA